MTSIVASLNNTGQRAWSLTNLDTGEVIVFTFEALNVRVSDGSGFVDIKSPGRGDPITQFVAGEPTEVSLIARLFARHTEDFAALLELTTLREWRRVDPALGRPPVLSLRIGDGHVQLEQCVIEHADEDFPDRVQVDGSFKGAEVSLRFKKYTPFTLTGGLPTESRYHSVRFGEYYELLAQDEYGDPALGDVLRARNPRMPLLSPGDVVKLPSAAAISREPDGPRSTALQTAFGKRDTPQRRRFREALANRSADFPSRVVKS